LTEMAWLVGKAEYKFNCAMDMITDEVLLKTDILTGVRVLVNIEVIKS